ncbi:MAG: type II toxin-antitoxin system VapC family toxin [Methylacidiphilales bacterium]|nr:type II toxin-antitoxin system VapC family toxin [Candidatus Methylacidiphilales bacterium]
MTYLIDANVLSDPTKPEPHPGVHEWLRAHETYLVVDPIVLGEIHFSILLLPRGRKRRNLERWFHTIITAITCLPWDANVGLQWAKLLAELRRTGQSMPIKDSMIAATALAHKLTVVTRNDRDFKKAGVPVINPFQTV